MQEVTQRKRSKKIVHIITTLEMGGAQKILYDLVQNLQEYEHLIVCFQKGYFYDRFMSDGIQVHHVHGLLRYDPIFFVRLARLIGQCKPDLLHGVLWAAGSCASVLGRLYRIPYLISLHNNLQLNGRVRKSIDRIINPAARGTVIAVSHEVAQSAEPYYGGAKKIVVIENGIDVQKLHAVNATMGILRKDLEYDEHHMVIGSVGRFDPVKNYSQLINSFAAVHTRYPHTRLLLLGAGPLEQSLRAQIQELDLQQVAKLVIGKPAAAFYHLFDYFVQTSHTEGISLALLEAMSFGKPAVVLAKTHQVMTHGHDGLLVPHSHDLAPAIMYLLDNPAFAQQLGLQAPQTVADCFSLERMVNHYRTVFATSC